MHKKAHLYLLVVMLLGSILTSCKFSDTNQFELKPNNTPIQTPEIPAQSSKPEVVQNHESTPTEVIPAVNLEIIEPNSEPISQAPYYSITEPYFADDIGLSSKEDCFNALEGMPINEEAVTLTLYYKQQLNIESVDLYIKGALVDILSIDLLDQTSGESQHLYTEGDEIQQGLENVSPCANLYRVLVSEPIGADIVQVKFKNSSDLASLISIEVNGKPYLMQDWLLFWEQSLPGQVADLAISNLGLIFLAISPHQVYKYDIEGNLLDQFSLDEDTNISNIELDPNGDLIIADAAKGVFWSYTQSGVLISSWEGQTSKMLATNPIDGNLYTLIEIDDQLFLSQYDSREGRLQTEIPVQQNLGYVDLSFDPRGNLFALHNYDTALVQLDTTSGAVQKSIPVQKALNLEYEGSSLDFDLDGNAYVLFSYSANQTSVYRLNTQGELIGRYGEIVPDIADGSPKTALCKPRFISVTEEGRYLVIADECFGSYRLMTYYLGEPD